MSRPIHSHSRANDRGMSAEVRALSTRVIDPRAAARGAAWIALLVAAVIGGLARWLWEGADTPGPATTALLERADPEPTLPPPIPPRRITLVLVDGLRVDEAMSDLPGFQALRNASLHGVATYPLPTLSTGGYHAMLTGARNELSAVRTNRFAADSPGRPARLDTLADRVRGVGGQVAVVAEGLPWFAGLLAPPELRILEGEAFWHAAEALVAEERGLRAVHILSVDESAHDGGFRGRPHRAALARADAFLQRVLDTRAPSDVLWIASDHGHLDIGGHGGGEATVTSAPYFIIAPDLEPREGPRLDAECVVSVVTTWANLPWPRHATCGPHPALTPAGARFDPTPIFARSAAAHSYARVERGLAKASALRLSALIALLSLMGLGVLKRGFSGFDRGTLIAPFLTLGVVAMVHAFIWGKPFSLSAIHRVNAHLVLTGVVGALGAGLGLILSYVATRDVVGVRRAAAAIVWAAGSAFMFVWADIAGTYAPWPETDFQAYAPVLCASAGIGGCLVSAAILRASVADRFDPGYARPGDRGSGPNSA